MKIMEDNGDEYITVLLITQNPVGKCKKIILGPAKLFEPKLYVIIDYCIIKIKINFITNDIQAPLK